MTWMRWKIAGALALLCAAGLAVDALLVYWYGI